MFFNSRYPILFLVLGLITNPLPAQQKSKNLPSRTFVHSRGSQEQDVDSWTEDGVTYFNDIRNGKMFRLVNNKFENCSIYTPSLPPNTKGIIKYRQGFWWLLVHENGQLPKNKVSSLLRFNPKENQWILVHKLDLRVANFEPLPDESFFLSGTYSPKTECRDIAMLLSPSGSLSQLEAIPFKNFEEMFWQNCVTTIDDEMVFLYFPFPGNMYGYDLKNKTIRAFRTPWPLITAESIQKDQEAAAGKDCFISAVGHPSASQCYFAPALPGQMAFVYKCLDEDQEKAHAFSDGKRPLVEKVSSFMMYRLEPNQVFELDTPSRFLLDQWYWSPIHAKFFRWTDAMTPSKPVLKGKIPSIKRSTKPGTLP